MSKSDFDKFVEKQTKKAQEKEIDWSAQLSEWRDYLNQFYQSVELFLKPYLENKSISISRSRVQLDEENIGSYEVEAMQLQIGNSKVKLEPIGTLLIGAKGRVDMNGPRGSVKFVLVAKNSSGPKINVRVWIEGENEPPKEKHQPVTEWSWKIAGKSPQMTYVELSEDSFFDALLEVANG